LVIFVSSICEGFLVDTLDGFLNSLADYLGAAWQHTSAGGLGEATLQYQKPSHSWCGLHILAKL
jgi:hypothetical protein